VTPDCCPEVKLYQLHITGDIAFAARQYISATRDIKWLKKEKGNILIQNIAKFWASRISYNKTKRQFEIKGFNNFIKFYFIFF
jgi:trehalose/maltose hydrolase-like predicted phosphorylase